MLQTVDVVVSLAEEEAENAAVALATIAACGSSFCSSAAADAEAASAADAATTAACGSSFCSSAAAVSAADAAADLTADANTVVLKRRSTTLRLFSSIVLSLGILHPEAFAFLVPHLSLFLLPLFF